MSRVSVIEVHSVNQPVSYCRRLLLTELSESHAVREVVACRLTLSSERDFVGVDWRALGPGGRMISNFVCDPGFPVEEVGRTAA